MALLNIAICTVNNESLMGGIFGESTKNQFPGIGLTNSIYMYYHYYA